MLGGGRIEVLFIEGYREFISPPGASQSYRTLFLALADRQKVVRRDAEAVRDD